MYGRLFEATFTGSMMGAGSDVFAVWAYVIANKRGGEIELNPKFLSAIIGEDVAKIEKAIEFLCQPDPYSRSSKKDGKRLIKVGQFQYSVVNSDEYDKIQKAEERRRYLTKKQREHRTAVDCQQPSTTVNNCQHTSTAVNPPEADTNTEPLKASSTSSNRLSHDHLMKAKTSKSGNSGGGRKSVSDEEWLRSIGANEAYAGIDIRLELARMDAWLSTRPGRKKTRKFIVNWLNRVDKQIKPEKDPLHIDLDEYGPAK